jgi:hypothetical protein
MSIGQFTKTCVGCEVELRCKENGVLLVEAATFGFVTIRDADLWHCPVCLHEIIAGVAAKEHFGHWEGDIMAEIKRRENRGQRVVLCWLNAQEKAEFLWRGKEAAEKAAVGL